MPSDYRRYALAAAGLLTALLCLWPPHVRTRTIYSPSGRVVDRSRGVSHDSLSLDDLRTLKAPADPDGSGLSVFESDIHLGSLACRLGVIWGLALAAAFALRPSPPPLEGVGGPAGGLPELRRRDGLRARPAEEVVEGAGGDPAGGRV